jgi:hypothetical protein
MTIGLRRFIFKSVASFVGKFNTILQKKKERKTQNKKLKKKKEKKNFYIVAGRGESWWVEDC